MKYLLVILIIVLLCSCQQKNDDVLVIGLIRPSLNHLPLQYAIHLNPDDFADCKLYYFSSGWETNEALVNGKIDLAIMPFTYIYTDVSQNKKVKIISFFERESDGIIARKNIRDLDDLQYARLGVLKSSTLDIIPQLIFALHNLLIPELVYFRTPMDMAVALKSGNVDALCYYVPPIFNFSDDYKIIHWLSDSFPSHTCCNIAATDYAINKKNHLIKNLMKILETAIQKISPDNQDLISFASDYYGIPPNLLIKSLEHTKYITGLAPEFIEFESLNAQIMVDKGYMQHRVKADEVYHNILP